jgi:agmatinase
MRALGKKFDGKLGVIHLDAHNDAMGSEPITSASFDLMVDEGMVDPNRWITVGLRFAPSDYFSNIIYGNDCVRLGPKKTAERIREVVGDGPVFITFDVDFLNPTDFSSTSLPTPGGPGIHELRGLFYYLQSLNIVGADCVEYNPLLDNQGKRDGHQLAFLLTDLVALLAISRGKAKPKFEYEW